MCALEKKIFGVMGKNWIYTLCAITWAASTAWSNFQHSNDNNNREIREHIELSHQLFEQQNKRLTLLEKTMTETRVDIKWVLASLDDIKDDTKYLKKKERERSANGLKNSSKGKNIAKSESIKGS